MSGLLLLLAVGSAVAQPRLVRVEPIVLVAPSVAVTPAVAAQTPVLGQPSLPGLSLTPTLAADPALRLPVQTAANLGPAAARPAAPDSIPLFVTADAKDAEFLTRVLEESRRSATARRVLRRAEKMVAALGRPIPIEITDVRPLAGDYSYDTEVIRISSRQRKRPAVDSAALLIHEVAHAVQKSDKGIPSFAFEGELEAYAIDLRMDLELGLTPRPGSFDEKVWRRFKKDDFEGFMKWLRDTVYKNDLGIIGMGLRETERRLRRNLRDSRARVERLEKRLAARKATRDSMVGAGHPETLVKNYEAEEIAKLEEKLRVERTIIAWNEADIALLKDPAGRRRYQAYARNVLTKLRRLHKQVAEREAGR